MQRKGHNNKSNCPTKVGTQNNYFFYEPSYHIYNSGANKKNYPVGASAPPRPLVGSSLSFMTNLTLFLIIVSREFISLRDNGNSGLGVESMQLNSA